MCIVIWKLSKKSNIARHAVYTIVSTLNPKLAVSHSDFMVTRSKTYILRVIEIETGKRMYRIKENRVKWFNLRHSIDRVYVISNIYVLCFRIIILPSATMYPIICTQHRLHSSNENKYKLFRDLYPNSMVPRAYMGPPGGDRTQVGPMLALWTLLSWYIRNN